MKKTILFSIIATILLIGNSCKKSTSSPAAKTVSTPTQPVSSTGTISTNMSFMDAGTASGTTINYTFVNEASCWYSINGGSHKSITVSKTLLSAGTSPSNYGYYQQSELLNPGDVVTIGYPSATIGLVIGENNPQSSGVVSVNNMQSGGTTVTYTSSVITYTVH